MDPTPPPSPPPTPAPPAAAAEPALSNLPTICPICGEAREEDAQFCEACGHNFAGENGAPARIGRLRGPLLWLVILGWAIIAVIGLAWLYTGLYGL